MSDKRFISANVALCFAITLRILEMAAMRSRKIYFHSLEKAFWLRNRRHLQRFIATVFTAEKANLSKLDIIFCADDYLLELNKKFLNHSTYTDVISFNLSDSAAIVGEIYISLDRVTENSELFTTTRSQELLRVIFHGVLHLTGYSDKTEAEKKMIRVKEDLYLKKYQAFLSRVPRET